MKEEVNKQERIDESAPVQLMKEINAQLVVTKKLMDKIRESGQLTKHVAQYEKRLSRLEWTVISIGFIVSLVLFKIG